MEIDEVQRYKNRLFVADLILDVLKDKISVSQALSRFPNDKNDINIKCAFDALMHREADEDLRKKIKDFALVQDDFLADIAQILKENQQMPKNIIEGYLKYHQDNLLADSEVGLKKILKNLKRMINF